MAIYLVTGKLGAGKTLASVGRIRDALMQGRKVATNLDLSLDKLFGPRAGKDRPISVLRLPDKPTVADLEVIGTGNESYDEERNGLIVLDELGSWLNARQFQDKTRGPVIDWLIHSRKKGWDVIFIVQHINMIDKQARDGLVEFLVSCRRLDRVKIPFVGGLIRHLSADTFKGNMPKVHVATVRYGAEVGALVAERWVYRGHDLYQGYDTRQIFRGVFLDDDAHKTANPPPGVYSYLPPWLTHGRYLPRPLGWRDYLSGIVAALLQGPQRPPRPALKPKHPMVELVMRLPPDQRPRHFRRLQALGVI